MIGTTQTLLSDVYDYKRKQQGKKGDKVIIISVSDPAVIVEAKGFRYVTRIENLTA